MGALVLAVEKPYWQDVMLELQAQGVEIAAAVVHYRDVPGPNHFFEKFTGKMIQGKPFYRLEQISKKLVEDFGTNFPALDREVIKAFEKAERDYYSLTDRFSYFPKSFRYRKRLFRESLRYWLAFFKQNNITAVFHGCTPHNLADYVGYHVAKYLNIPLTLVGHTMINDYVIINHDYREKNKVPASFMPDAGVAELEKAIPEMLLKNAMSDSKVLQIVISANDASVGSKKMNVKPAKKKKDFKRLAKRMFRSFVKTPKFKAALAMDAIYSPLARRLIKLNEIRFLKAGKRLHDELAVTPDLNEKFIYFAMHLQPERTSTPEAEVFEDHLLAIDILAKALPDGWKLYVKENPRQYDKINFIKGHHQRDISDYNDFLKNPRIRLISQKIPSKELLQNAQAVSTLSGSVGWEALKAGKPCIIFANAWYSACESAYRVESVDEAKQAIAECVKSTPEQVNKNILRYLAYMQNRLNIGNMGTGSYLKSSGLPYATIVKEMAARIAAEIRRK